MEAKISAPTRLEEILAEWDLDEGKKDDSYTVDLSSVLNNVSVTSPYTVTGAIGTNTIWTTGTGTTTAPWLTANPTGARIQLDGEDADITVRGWSLVDAVKRIEERLGLFQPNPELEREWEDLCALGEQYRKLEQYIKEKQATFDRLKSMPAPDTN